LFGLVWDYKTLKTNKILYVLGDYQEVLNMDKESPKILRFVLFGVIRLQETFEKKNWGLED
jgi:hypothetical protein